MKRGLTILLVCWGFIASAQYSNNIWCFGDSAGINFSDTSNLSIITSAIRSRGTCVSIADSFDSLLFSANTRAATSGNTTLVWNNNNALMQDGDSIVGRGWYHELVIVPFPESDSLFYLFSIGVTTTYGLYYSVIDMSLDSGKGAVIQRNVLLQTFPMVDCLTAIKHGNGRDWWILFRKSDFLTGGSNNDFYLYLVTPSGISNVIIQTVGSLNSTNAGRICFNPEGDKFVFINFLGLIEEYDFDRCTGTISNPFTIEPELSSPPYPYYWSCAFSSDGNRLFISSYNQPPSTSSKYLYEYDLGAANISASRQTIYTFNPPIGVGFLKLAPDNKIYLSCMYECPTVYCYPYPDSVYNYINMNLSVINQPDSLGVACNFTPFSFYLGGHRTYYGLPNNPDYELGAVPGSICDSLTSVNELIQNIQLQLKVFPNPVATKDVLIQYTLEQNKTGLIEVINTTGQIVFRQTLPQWSSQQRLTLPTLSQGVYLMRLQSGDKRAMVKFVKE